MKLHIDARPCGTGKTYRVLKDAALRPQKLVYVVARVVDVAARREMIREICRDHGAAVPIIDHIVSVQGQDMGIRQQIERAPDIFANNTHVILIITHEGMKMAKHDRFAGWSIVIDEDPITSYVHSWNVPVSRDVIANNYALTPVGAGFSQVTPRADRATVTTILNDSLVNELAQLERRCQTSAVFCDRTDWDDFADNTTFTWWSHWLPTALEAYDRVTIIANNFTNKVSFKVIGDLFGELFEIEFINPDEPPREFEPRRVLIEYFASLHPASRATWTNRKEGRVFFQQVCDYVTDRTTVKNHIWCVNTYQKMTSLPGIKVSSKVAGSNDYDHITDCTILYSAKASPVEIKVFRDFHGEAVTASDFVTDRECEDLIQIALRTTLRVPHDTRDVTLRVYDRAQADVIAAYLAENYGYTVDVVLVPGFEHIDFAPRPTGRPSSEKPPVSAKDRMKAYRARLKALRKGGEGYPPLPLKDGQDFAAVHPVAAPDR